MTIGYDGEFIDHEGEPAVRFQRTFDVSPEQVWLHAATPEGMRNWFPAPEVSFEPEVGAVISMSGDPYDPDGQQGTILAYEEGSRLGFGWGKDELYLTVSAAGSGSQLVLLDRLDERDAAARNAAGWDFCLQALTRSIEGATSESPTSAGAAATGTEATGSAAAGSAAAQSPGMDDFLPVLKAYQAKGLPDDGWLPTPPG